MLLFGGWSNRWLGDTWKANVSSIIGPPYACVAVSPSIGPVFGDTTIQLKGLRFRDGKCQVHKLRDQLSLIDCVLDSLWKRQE